MMDITSMVGGFFGLVYIGGFVAVIIFLLLLFKRFVLAHERAANALEVIACKLRDDGRP